MSTLVETARKALRLGDSTDDQVRGLTDAVTAARGRLDDDAVDSASTVASRAAERLKLSAEHTVVAIAGATGSGKSSTFNALSLPRWAYADQQHLGLPRAFGERSAPKTC